MDYKDLTSILLKTAGATLIFWYVSWLPSALSTGFEWPFDGAKLFIELLPPLFGLGLALFIFNFPATITNKLINGEKLSQSEGLANTLQVGAIRLIGIYHLLTGTIDLVHHFSVALLTPRLYENMGIAQPPSGWTPDLIGWTISTFIELAIALWFVLGAEGIIRLVHKTRGRDKH